MPLAPLPRDRKWDGVIAATNALQQMLCIEHCQSVVL